MLSHHEPKERHSKFVIIHTDRNEENYKELFLEVSSILSSISTYEINSINKLILKLNGEIINKNYESLENAKMDVKNDRFQFIIEYDLNNQNILTIYDEYFSQTTDENMYRVEMNHLYLNTVKYSESEINRNRLFDSITYGLFKELSNHHSTNKKTFHRGFELLDYLYKNPPQESYQIIKKAMDAKKLSLHFFEKNQIKKNVIDRIFNEVDRNPPISQINLDNFNFEELQYALENVGTFELIGPSINNFTKLAEAALTTCKDIFDLPKEKLEKVAYTLADFHGYQNVREETLKNFQLGKSTIIKNQHAFHFKPYLESKAPEGINMKAYEEYYEQGLVLLNILLRKIAIHFGLDPATIIDYLKDRKSVLTSRRYFTERDGETGIQEHSDYGHLTMVVSNQRGLEVKQNDQWIIAPHQPNLRFYINVGDWLGFQLRNLGVECKMGVHRVPEVKITREMLALFLNPDPNQMVKVPNGEIIPYQTYLMSPKTPYILKRGN